jgi:hypothetical protein
LGAVWGVEIENRECRIEKCFIHESFSIFNSQFSIQVMLGRSE